MNCAPAAAPSSPVPALEARLREVRAELDPESRELLAGWSDLAARYRAPATETQVRDRVREFSTHRETLSGTRLPRVALPALRAIGTGCASFSKRPAGPLPVHRRSLPVPREEESPRRQFAGEGGPARTNRRFHLLADSEAATRLSVAFDSVTSTETILPGPDIFGKIGEGGVSIAPSTTCANCSGGSASPIGDQRFHDHQRSGSADPCNVPERRGTAGASGLRGRARTPAFRGRVRRTESRDP